MHAQRMLPRWRPAWPTSEDCGQRDANLPALVSACPAGDQVWGAGLQKDGAWRQGRALLRVLLLEHGMVCPGSIK